MPALMNPPQEGVFVTTGPTRGAQALDELEQSIAHTIQQWQPGQKASALSQRKIELVSLRHDLFHGLVPTSPPAERDRSARQLEPSGPIDEALKKTTEAHLQALSQAGLPIYALSLLQSWMELTVDARVLQQQLSLERVINGLRSESLVADEPVATSDPAAPLSAAELGQALGGFTDETVRYREKAGELFSILRPGRKRGREYPAFQAWSGVTGAPLAKVLAKLGAPAATVGADAYSFFTSPTDLLGGATPIEALLGSLSTARNVGPNTKRLLGSSADERLKAVLQAAEAYAAQVAA